MQTNTYIDIENTNNLFRKLIELLKKTAYTCNSRNCGYNLHGECIIDAMKKKPISEIADTGNWTCRSFCYNTAYNPIDYEGKWFRFIHTNDFSKIYLLVEAPELSRHKIIYTLFSQALGYFHNGNISPKEIRGEILETKFGDDLDIRVADSTLNDKYTILSLMANKNNQIQGG